MVATNKTTLQAPGVGLDMARAILGHFCHTPVDKWPRGDDGGGFPQMQVGLQRPSPREYVTEMSQIPGQLGGSDHPDTMGPPLS